MAGKLMRLVAVVVFIFLAYLAYAFLFPYGAIPQAATPNCGPETRANFDVSIEDAGDVIKFLQSNENLLVAGSASPSLSQPPGNQPGLMPGFEPDWKALQGAVQVEKRLVHTIFSLTYSPAACPGQFYTLRITEDGRVSLNGCCGK